MQKKFLAHSANMNGEGHALLDHHEGVAARIEVFTRGLPEAKKARIVAWLHDIGKYQDEFQSYLEHGGRRGCVPHAKWGALLARALKADDVSFAIDGHHAGLPDAAEWSIHTFADASCRETLTKLTERFTKDAGPNMPALAALRNNASPMPRERDIRTRFLFSCLVDADWLDTEAHFSPDIAAWRQERRLDADGAMTRVDAALEELEKNETPLNALRTAARLAALEKAGLPPGFFSLNLPTGLGKTLCSFRWALEHAKNHSLERIIIVLPYTSIIDQTAARLKAILGEDSVLEHHSGYLDHTLSDDAHEQEDPKRLACENWAHPVIVTTSVQFFETLFSNRPSKCRKLHNIRRSVVILDEVQTLRKDLVLPTLDMLEDVRSFLECSFVFCTATLPAFEKRPSFPGLDQITPLAGNAPELFERTRRVRYRLLDDLRPVLETRLEAELQALDRSALVICNTKNLARKLFAQARHGAGCMEGWDSILHLSTSMCPHHRKAHIRRISAECREPGRRVLVFSTQLVEAGVDLDFPIVFREIGPLESVIQAAGRCNREGALSDGGEVLLFSLEESRYPDDLYGALAEFVRMRLQADANSLHVHETFHSYYAQVMDLFVAPAGVTSMREKLNFKTVAHQYRLIDSNTKPLFIWGYNEDSRALYAKIKAKERSAVPLSRNDYRQIQQYSVQVYESDLRKARRWWEKSGCGVLVWNGDYSDETGIILTSKQEKPLIC